VPIERLDHLVLTVRDLAATTDFYTRVLGMELVTFGDHRLALRFGAQKINLHLAGKEGDPKADRPTPGAGDLCFITHEAPQAWVARLREAGVAVIAGPVRRTGALGPIESVYLRDPDGNLLEIARPAPDAGDDIAPLRDWLRQWQERVRALDFDGGRRLCTPEVTGFGTYTAIMQGVDRLEAEQWRHVWPTIRDFTIDVERAVGAVAGDSAWVAAPWGSRGVRADGSTFSRPGRCTVAFEKRQGRWLACHTHFSLTPERA
jgi:catechol 2,3-dioxygenase-like lactoylglutathione lyase family enzyme/ketosteroid isomerase-like protein